MGGEVILEMENMQKKEEKGLSARQEGGGMENYEAGKSRIRM